MLDTQKTKGQEVAEIKMLGVLFRSDQERDKEEKSSAGTLDQNDTMLG